MFPGNRWIPVKDGDPRAFSLYKRHYTYREYKDGRRKNLYNGKRFLVTGPGIKLVLLTVDCQALFVWRKFVDKSGQKGVNCAVFRNEGPHLSSELILEAEELALVKFPGERFYTYVSPDTSKNPGYCFLCAGWKRLPYRTKVNKLHILEKIND